MHFSIVSVDMGFFLLDPGRRNCSLLLPLAPTAGAGLGLFRESSHKPRRCKDQMDTFSGANGSCRYLLWVDRFRPAMEHLRSSLDRAYAHA